MMRQLNPDEAALCEKQLKRINEGLEYFFIHLYHL